MSEHRGPGGHGEESPRPQPDAPRGPQARPEDLERIRVVRPGFGRFAQPPVPPVPPPPPGPPSAGSPPEASDGDDPEGQELRVLLHRAVGGIEPTPGSLERLRAAVPERRSRRRRAMGGSVALLALLGITVPIVNAATSPSVRVDAGSSSSSTGTAQRTGASTGGSPGAVQSSGALVPYGPAPSGRPTASQLPGGSGVIQSWGYGGAGASGGTPGASLGGSLASLPECSRAQLGGGRAALGHPAADGTVYGVFWVTNVSSTTCVVAAPGTVAVTSAQGTDPSRVRVQMHTNSDPATALPDPRSAPAAVALAPSGTYQVDFAWVPDSSGCPTAAGTPSGDSSGSGASGTGGTGSADAGPAASPSATGGPGAQQPGITLGHTPGAGSPVAVTVQISGACSGTVYRTEPLPVTSDSTNSGSPAPSGSASASAAASAAGGTSG